MPDAGEHRDGVISTGSREPVVEEDERVDGCEEGFRLGGHDHVHEFSTNLTPMSNVSEQYRGTSPVPLTSLHS